jgi:hypothetical protein
MPEQMWRSLGLARQRVHLSVPDLHLRYIALGGRATGRQLTDHLATGAELARIERELVVLSLNERFMELGMSERLPFGSGGGPGPPRRDHVRLRPAATTR